MGPDQILLSERDDNGEFFLPQELYPLGYHIFQPLQEHMQNRLDNSGSWSLLKVI